METAGVADSAFDQIENGLENSGRRDLRHSYSLHGSKAAFRKAVTELLFFASVGGEYPISEQVQVLQCMQVCLKYSSSTLVPVFLKSTLQIP